MIRVRPVQPLFPGLGQDQSLLEAVVNVATVPQRSPFRYAGGKTWFTPRLRRWLATVPQRPALFVEPFVGGGSLSCAVLCEGLADRVLMIELDEDVVSVWQIVFSQDAPRLASRIIDFEFGEVQVFKALAELPQTTLERAFQTILRNRVNRGGILAPGAGMIRAGEAGRGLASRWYPQTLARRILELHAHRDRVTVLHADGLEQLDRCPDAAVLLDPPYTAGGKKAGSRLYRHAQLDHMALFRRAASLEGPFLMTYDHTPEVTELAYHFGLSWRAIAMKNTHHAQLSELVIGRDLSWL